jgi:hypothetical protein
MIPKFQSYKYNSIMQRKISGGRVIEFVSINDYISKLQQHGEEGRGDERTRSREEPQK